MPHVPVLLDEVIDWLDLRPGMFVIDGTVDGGGHAEKILERIGPSGKLLGLDWDEDLLAQCRERLAPHSNVILRHANYADVTEILKAEELPRAHAFILDLGFSSEQLETGKGFSFSQDEPLLLTYSSESKPAHEVLRTMREKEIADMLFQFGEERRSRQIAKAIYAQEKSGDPIRTTRQLAEVVAAAVGPGYERGRIHPATRTFQALRIYVNNELGNLKSVLESLDLILQTGGRAAIISFHSLEDRIVKNSFRDLASAGTLEILTKKPIEASEAEVRANPRSRSAKLRVSELKDEY